MTSKTFCKSASTWKANNLNIQTNKQTFRRIARSPILTTANLNFLFRCSVALYLFLSCTKCNMTSYKLELSAVLHAELELSIVIDNRWRYSLLFFYRISIYAIVFSQGWLSVLKVYKFKILGLWKWLAYALAYMNK